MEVYLDDHDEEHYHLAGEPNSQHKIYPRILTKLKNEMPENYFIETIKEGDDKLLLTKSFRVKKRRNQVIFITCYKYKGWFPPKWRIKIMPNNEDFFENIFLPLLRTI